MPTSSETRQAQPVTSSRLIRRRFNWSVRALVLCPPLAAIALAFVLWKSPSTDSSAGHVTTTLLGVGLVWTALTFVISSAVVRAAKPLLAIRAAMGSIARGETCIEALRISGRFGPEAEAWNNHLTQVDAARKRTHASIVAESLAAAKPGAEALEQACGALWIGCIVLDASRRVVFCNGAASRLLRAPATGVIGKPVDVLIQDMAALEIIRQADASPGRRRFTAQGTSGDTDTETVLRYSVTRSGAETTAPLLILVEDLTQQHAADHARDTFVTHATHELRTPLTNIRLYVERAIEEGDNPTVNGECLNVINQETRRLERIVTDMLSASEIEAGSLRIEMGEVRLDAMMDEFKADYDELGRSKDVTFSVVVPPKMPEVWADREKLSMAIHNLLGNAFKYTPEGGCVTVAVTADEHGIAIIITDNGIGIRPEDQEHIFDRFFRASDQRVKRMAGTGLGLSLAREVVRLHGGDLTVHSEPERGSTFTLTVPNRAAAA
jgi:signal transduction histidine kinase